MQLGCICNFNHLTIIIFRSTVGLSFEVETMKRDLVESILAKSTPEPNGLSRRCQMGVWSEQPLYFVHVGERGMDKLLKCHQAEFKATGRNYKHGDLL